MDRVNEIPCDIRNTLAGTGLPGQFQISDISTLGAGSAVDRAPPPYLMSGQQFPQAFPTPTTRLVAGPPSRSDPWKK